MKNNTYNHIDESERAEYLDEIEHETEGHMSVFPDFEECLLYWTEDSDGKPCAVYCYEDLVESYARKNLCSYSAAVEYIDYNTMRTVPYMYKVGNVETGVPVIIHRIDRAYTTLPDIFFDEENFEEDGSMKEEIRKNYKTND